MGSSSIHMKDTLQVMAKKWVPKIEIEITHLKLTQTLVAHMMIWVFETFCRIDLII